MDVTIARHMTDEQRKQINTLLVNIARGDAAALDDLSCLVSARMLSVAMSVLCNRASAEDAVQEAFVRIVDNCNRYKRDTNGYAWICKVTQNVALNMLRSERRHSADNIDDMRSLPSDDDVQQRSETELLLQDAMSALTDVERQLVYRKYFMELTVRDIARDMGMSKSTVQRQIQLAEQKMKDRLARGTKSDKDVL